MTLADLALLAVSWLLMACLRLWLRVDPRYRGKRRAGSVEMERIEYGDARAAAALLPALEAPEYQYRVPPWTPEPLPDEETTRALLEIFEQTGPMMLPATYRSNGGRGVPEKTS